MNIPSSVVVAPSVASTANRPAVVATDETPAPQAQPDTASPAVQVTLSEEGKQKVEDDKYADIERSSLPKDVKEALKHIRDLQARIERKTEELEAIEKDASLSEMTRKSRRQAALLELDVMQSALATAQTALNSAMSSHNLNTKDRALAKGLVGLK